MAEVRTLDAGSWFVDANGGYRSARDFGTLDRLDPADIQRYRSGSVAHPDAGRGLIFTKEHDWLANVETKSFPDHPPGLVERVLEVIAATDAADRVLISSFDHDDTVAAAARGCGYGLGLLLATPIHRLGEYAVDLVGADTVHLSAEILGSESVAYRRTRVASSLRHDIVAALRDRGVPLWSTR